MEEELGEKRRKREFARPVVRPQGLQGAVSGLFGEGEIQASRNPEL